MAEKVKETKKPKSKARKIVDWIITVVFVTLFAGIAVFQIASNASKKKNHGVPMFANHATLVVLTDSMVPEYEVGTAVFVTKVDPSTLEVGDDVTFYYSAWSSYMSNPIVTHRLLTIKVNEDIALGSGRYEFTVHGINTDSDNCHMTGGNRDCTDQTQVFDENALVGKVTGSSKAVGVLYRALSSWYGLLLMLLIPCLYLIITSVLDIFKAYKDDDDEVVAEQAANPQTESNSSIEGLSEEDKERLKQELLDELMGGGNSDE